jgi:hypothetical protein
VLTALTATDKATMALAAVTGILALVALIQLIAFNRSEARRTQPVVILNKGRGRDLVSGFGVFMTNEGSGTGFNVRVGLRIDGTEWPLGDDEGNRYTVAAGARQPRTEADTLTVGAPTMAYRSVPGGKSTDQRTIFYARYENAFGKVWETLNPNDPLAPFKVRRARRPHRFHAWRQRRRRAKVLKIGEEPTDVGPGS